MSVPSWQRAPQISKGCICIVDRENVALAAVVSSYLQRPGHYTPLFTFPGVEDPDRGQDRFEEDDYVAKMVGTSAAVFISNALSRLEANGFVILAGLSEAQKSYMQLSGPFKTIEIENVAGVPRGLAEIGITSDRLVLAKPTELLLGLHKAILADAALAPHEDADAIAQVDEAGAEGLVVIEDAPHAACVAAVAYAHSVGADVRIVPSVKRSDVRRALDLVQAWKDRNDSSARDSLFSMIDERLGSMSFASRKYVTFFTDGLPYTIKGTNDAIFTYVNLSLSADHFLVNNILAESQPQLQSAVVFSIDEFLSNGEARLVARTLQDNNFHVRVLSGIGATGFSFGYHVEHFPYGVFHIVSHGGEIDGYAVTEEFTDRENVKHTLEYDEVVGIHRVLTERDLFGVQRKVIFRSIDGLDWNSEERMAAGIPHYVYEDMRKQLFSKEHWGKGSKRIPKSNIPGSCCVQCNGGIHQAMFHSVGGYGNPLIFNNTCWSWWGISEFFIAGGSRAYLGTFWAVDDAAAVTAAETFYGHLFRGTIAEAFHAASRSISDTEDAGIYAFWGLHFSTLASGTSLRNSVHDVCDRLAALLQMYARHLDSGITEDDVRTNAIEAVELLDHDFDALCGGPGVDRLRAKIQQSLEKAGPKKRNARKP